MAIGCSAGDPSPDGGGVEAGVDGPDGGDSSGAEAAPACTERAGGFRLIDDELEGASFEGRIHVRPPVFADDRTVVLREQACTVYYLVPRGSGCDELRCPEKLDVGTVTVSGLRESLSSEPWSEEPLYWDVLQRSDPSSEEGAAIALEASGGANAPFALHVTGVGQVVAPEQDVVVEGDRPVRIEWQPPRARSALHMAIELRISERSWIACDVPDTGAFEISGSLVAALLRRNPSLTNGLTLTRYSSDATEIAPGCVDFLIASSISLPITIPSLIPCPEGVPCPEGKVCQSNFVCR